MRRWIWRLLGYRNPYWVIRNSKTEKWIFWDCDVPLVTADRRRAERFLNYADAERVWLNLGIRTWVIEEVNTW